MIKSARKQTINCWFKQSARGQSLVEAALFFPILLLILMGVVDLGRAYITLVVLQDAASEGAAYAAINPTQTAHIVGRTVGSSNELVRIDPAGVSVQYGSLTPGSPITVTVQYSYEFMMPLVGALLPDNSLTMQTAAAKPIMSY